MNLALTGAHGTGKTTLLGKLTDLLRQGGITADQSLEVPRLICESVGDPEFFRRGKNSLTKQCMILLGQASQDCLLARSGATVHLFDRTLLDHWAYTLHLFRDDREMAYARPVIERLVRSHMSNYDEVFLLRPEFPPIDDGTREGDVEFQQAIDLVIFEHLTSWAIPFRILSGAPDARAQSVLKVLKEEQGYEL